MRQIVATIAVLLVVAASGWAQQVIDQRLEAAPDGVVEITNVAGSVEVTGWSRAEVEITGTLGRGSEGLDVSSSGHRIRIEVKLPHNARKVDGSDLVIRVPAGSRLEVSAVSASISTADLVGRLVLESVSGSVDVAGTPSGLEAESVSGDVKVERAPDRAEIASVSGDIMIAWAEGSIEAASVSGDVVVRDGALSGADLATTSGDIRFTAAIAGNGSFDMESMSGNVVVTVPAGLAADFEISTFSGSIRSQLGPEPSRTDRYTPGEELNFSTGAGGPRVTLSSFSGSVELKTR